MQNCSRRLRSVWISALAACAGCAGGQATSSAPGIPMSSLRQPQPAHRAGGWLSPAARLGKHLIYVSDFTKNVVQIYPAKGSNPNPIGQITDGISGPEGSFVDEHGNLFVANVTNYTVTMYPRASTTWKLRYTGFAYPIDVTVGRDGMVYVVDLVGQKVVEFPKGKTRSKRTIAVTYPHGVALDPQNDLYVSYDTGAHGAGPGQVNEYAPGSTKGTSLGLPIVWAAGDAVDGASDVVVADQGSGSNAAVYVFPPGSTKPSHTINQGMQDPFQIALDRPFKHLYVADPSVNALLVYDFPAGTLVNTITNGLSSVYGVAIAPGL
jgi:hypothetical protein